MRRLLGPLVPALIATLGVGTATADVGSLTRVSGASPFEADCNGAPQTGTVFRSGSTSPLTR